jgi:hypothetical protein
MNDSSQLVKANQVDPKTNDRSINDSYHYPPTSSVNSRGLKSSGIDNALLQLTNTTQPATKTKRNRRSHKGRIRGTSVIQCKKNINHSMYSDSSSYEMSEVGEVVDNGESTTWVDSPIDSLMNELLQIEEGLIIGTSKEKVKILEHMRDARQYVVPYLVKTEVSSLTDSTTSTETEILSSKDMAYVHFSEVDRLENCPVWDIRHWEVWKYGDNRLHKLNDLPVGRAYNDSIYSYFFGAPRSSLPPGRPYVVECIVDKDVVNYCVMKFRGVSLQSTGAGRAWFYPCHQRFPDLDCEVLNNSVRYAFQQVERMQSVDRLSGLCMSVPKGMPN